LFCASTAFACSSSFWQDAISESFSPLESVLSLFVFYPALFTAEQEKTLRQPIEEYVGKIQKEIDELRKDGTAKVIMYQSRIENVKRDKTLSKGVINLFLYFSDIFLNRLTQCFFLLRCKNLAICHICPPCL